MGDKVKRREFIIFIVCLFVSVFLIGLGAGLRVSHAGYSLGIILLGLLINGLTHLFFWKKFWLHIKSLRSG
jgi:fucose permease